MYNSFLSLNSHFQHSNVTQLLLPVNILDALERMPVIPAPSSHGRRATNRDVQHKPSPTTSSSSENPDIIREKALGSPEPRMPAWDVLELEYPHHLQCYYCRDLHPLADIKSYNYRGHARCSRCLLAQCHKLNCRFRTKTYIHPDFSLTTFRMIMKQHRQGKDCNVLLKLLAYRSGVSHTEAGYHGRSSGQTVDCYAKNR